MTRQPIFHGTPNLETERLLLRKFRPDDVEDMFEYASNPEVTKYLSWDTHRNISETSAFIQDTIQKYKKDEAGDWGIVLKESNKFIGSCGFIWVEKKNACGNIGYVLSKDYWCQGIMTEAVKRLIQFGFDEMDMQRLEAVHFVENSASGRVMQKAGMEYEGMMRKRFFIKNRYWDIKQYAIVKE